MIPPLDLTPVEDLTQYATYYIEAAIAVIAIYVWVIYRRFPTKGRFIGPVEWILFGQGTRFAGNAVYITDWVKREFFDHLKNLEGEGAKIPEQLKELLASEDPAKRLYLYGMRSEAAVDRFDREFGKILIMSTEDIENPKFHDNLVARHIIWTVTKKRVVCAPESIELGDEIVQGWTTFAVVPRGVSGSKVEPSAPSREFSTIPWDKVGTMIGVLRAAATKASKEGLYKSIAASMEGKVHSLETEVRKTKDELDVAKKALSKKGLEGGETGMPLIPTKGSLIVWLFAGGMAALGGGLAYYNYNLPANLDEAAQLLLSKAVNNIVTGAVVAVIVVAAIVRWRMQE